MHVIVTIALSHTHAFGACHWSGFPTYNGIISPTRSHDSAFLTDIDLRRGRVVDATDNQTTWHSDFYRATACNATHGIAVAILSVCPSVRQMRVL